MPSIRFSLRVCAISLFALFAAVGAMAQSIGGNVSLAVTTSSANIQFPVATNGPGSFGYALLEYGLGSSGEIFYALGNSNAVAAVAPNLPTTQGSPALPANGVCIALGPNNWIAAIGAATSTLRVTQVNVCPTK
jgi:hypothetical protein